MPPTRELPSRESLVDYGHAVAGHAGTMSDPDGELFIKPCTQAEVDFYQSARRRHPEFAELMPEFLGTLLLNDSADLSSIEEGVVGPIAAAAMEQSEIIPAAAQAANPTDASTSAPADKDNHIWVPNKSRKIKTDLAVVLENTSAGFKKPNILDVKLGVRLWADDAPKQKKDRFDKISAATTHRDYGFRIAGMRVWKGDRDAAHSTVDEDSYRVYDKDYGRLHVRGDNLVDAFRGFIFNDEAGIEPAVARAVCAGFARDIRHVEKVLARHESRMYSASLLLVFEGDGEALKQAIEQNNDAVDAVSERRRAAAEAAAAKAGDKPGRTTARIDSGIGMDDEDDGAAGGDANTTEEEDEDDEETPALPKIYALKLIDFAHATWTPGQGPDENSLKGVRSLAKIFENLAR